MPQQFHSSVKVGVLTNTCTQISHNSPEMEAANVHQQVNGQTKHSLATRWNKKNEVLTHATTWLNLKNTVLSESSQTHKATYDFIYMKYPE